MHQRKTGLAKVKDIFNWAILTRVQEEKTKRMRKVKIVYSDIIVVQQKSSLILSIPIMNKLAIKHRLHISSNDILTEVFPSI